jgi:hypothetical protein
MCVAIVLLAATPLTVNAQICAPWDLKCQAQKGVQSIGGDESVYDFVSGALRIVGSIIAALAGVVIALESWFLQVILALSFNLVNSTPVKIGFPVVLSIANLAFVAGLIVIAIATILRQQSYGIKKILWKLVVMAIAVNFGLVICGAMLQVSDDVAKYFIESVSPGDAGGGTNYGGFASAIAGAFNPVGVLTGPDQIAENPAGATAALQGAKLGQEIGKFLLPFSALMATIGALFIIIITLGTLIAMLLLRYVKLGMLLITLPLAWAAFIFPAYNKYYKEWWTSFTKWAIFPPVVVFFLWLSLKISEVMNAKQDEYNFTKYESPDSGDGWAAIASFFTGIFTPTIEQVLRILIIWGLMMGGLSAAQKMGVTFADAGIKAVDAGKKFGLGVAGRYSKRGARFTYQKAQGGKLNKLLAENTLGQTIKSRPLRAIVTTFGSGVAGVGRAAERITQKGGKDVVEPYKKDVPDTPGEIRTYLRGNHNMPEMLAALGKLSPEELGKINQENGLGGLPLLEWFKRYGKKVDEYKQSALKENLKKMGLPLEALDKIKKGDWAGAVQDDGGVLDKVNARNANRLFDDNPFGMSKDEAEKFHAAILSEEGLQKRMAPQQFGTMVAEFNPKQLKKFNDAVEIAIGNGMKQNLTKQAAAYKALGKDIVEYTRENPGVRSRGVKSENISGEKGTKAREDIVREGSGAAPTPPPPPPSGGSES